MASIPEALAIAVRHHEAGRLEDAQRIYRRILAVRPDQADALHLLGLAHHQRGENDPAAEHISRAISIRADVAAFHCNLGAVFLAQGRLDEAVACYRKALELQPDFSKAHNNLGVALRRQRNFKEAMACYHAALELEPQYAEARYNLGNLWLDLGRPEEAAECFRRAIEAMPDYVEAHNSLGNALSRLCEFDKAQVCFRRALELAPDNAEAHNNLGHALAALGNMTDSMRAFDRAIELKQDYAEAYKGRSFLWLLAGEFVRGWRDYEWRLRTVDYPDRTFARPAWDGKSLAGKTILLHAEQGLGDTIQFIRYASLLQRQGARTIVECQSPLLGLLRRCEGIDHLLPAGSPLPDFDVHCHLMSVPGLCRTTLATIPAQVPYLWAEPELIEHWHARLNAKREFKIGIVWQGNPVHGRDRLRSMPLACFAPLARLDGVRLFSLQKGVPVDSRIEIVEPGDGFDEASGPFMDTAAVMMNLDLVVTCDTAVAHLAGALGVPVWVALPFMSDWRWLLGRSDSPWYPTMRLFRQKTPGDWAGVFTEIESALRERSRPA